MGVGGKIIPRIRLTSAKDLVEVEAELGKNENNWLTAKQRFFLSLLWKPPLISTESGDPLTWVDIILRTIILSFLDAALLILQCNTCRNN